MRLRIAARKTHKWLALLVGLQIVIWSLSGLYMTAVHIDTIHGDHLVRKPLERSVDLASLADPLAVAAGARSVQLDWIGDRPVYVVTDHNSERAFDAVSARPLPPLSKAEIRKLSVELYTGDEPISSTRLIRDIPGEIRGRKPPLWRVEFDHWNQPTFYLSPVTGAVITRRHELWRLFDVMWMLHIMDYDERENVNNWLLRPFTWAALMLALSGGWMLIYAFPRRKARASP
ncbi:PepSY domain-containing protein [Sphingomonas mesophila]|uniref:PepSY domain-containing protein n=1 Tax=Sphingomonas mesophila TaxID=2303576 RepID=UPI000E5910AF|nr:PepSY domain-containing protein [Sphingomonas mesophila]